MVWGSNRWEWLMIDKRYSNKAGEGAIIKEPALKNSVGRGGNG